MSAPVPSTTGALAAPELPSACPGCGAGHLGDRAQGGAKWLAWRAHARAMEGLTIPGVVEGDPRLTLTLFSGSGVTDARGGQRWEGSLEDLETLVRDHAARVVEKGSGGYFAEAELRGGRRRDRDVTAWTSETIDIDGVPGGDWGPLRAALEVSGLGGLLWRSNSHTTEAPRWRCAIPFSSPIPYDHTPENKAEWSARRGWLLGWVSSLAGLPGVGRDYEPSGRHTPACGADLRGKTGPGQPVYLPARRTPGQDLPEVIRIDGGALDLERFLEETGYHDARAAFLAQEASKPKRKAPTPAATRAGVSGATVKSLPQRLRVEVEAWANRWGSTFDGCANRHDAELAIGGYLGARGVAPSVARCLVELLTPDSARGRGAADSAECGRRGGRVMGLPTVRRLLGEEAAADLAELTEDLGAQGRLERDALIPFDHQLPLGKADGEAADAILRHWLGDGSPSGLLDASPTGTGKSTALASTLVDVLGDDERRGKVYVAAERHEQHDDETLSRIREAERRAGRRLQVAKHEPFECPLPGAAGPAKTDEWNALAAKGWSPAGPVCGGCERFPGRQSPGDAPACATWVERLEVREARVQLAMHAHIPHLSLGERDRLVIDEDPTQILAPEVRIGAGDLGRFEQQLYVAALEGANRLNQNQESDLGDRLVELVEAARVGVEVLRAALPGEAGWFRLASDHCDLEGLRDRKAARAAAAAMADTEAPNLFPALVALAEASAGGLAARRVLPRKGEKGGPALVLTAPVRLPSKTPVMVLDATADGGLLEQLLERPVEVLRRAPAPVGGGAVLQLVDKPRFLSSFTDKDGPRQLEHDAGVIARWVMRATRRGIGGERIRVAIVTSKRVEEQLGKLVRAKVHSLRSRGQKTPRVELRHWGALRGSNEFSHVDVGIVHSAPVPPREVLERLALLRFPDVALGDLTAEPEWKRFDYRGAVAEGWLHANEPLRWAWRYAVGSELVQGLGRFDRGRGTPAGGVLVMTGVPFATVGEVTATTEADLCLGERGDALLIAAERLLERQGLPESDRELAAVLGCGRRSAARVRALAGGGVSEGLRRHAPASPPAAQLSCGVQPAPLARVFSTYIKDPSHFPEGACQPSAEAGPRSNGWGRADINRDCEGGPIRSLVAELGQRGAARALGIAPRSLRRYLAGEREAPVEVIERAIDSRDLVS